jgi:serine protease Do
MFLFTEEVITMARYARSIAVLALVLALGILIGVGMDGIVAPSDPGPAEASPRSESARIAASGESMQRMQGSPETARTGADATVPSSDPAPAQAARGVPASFRQVAEQVLPTVVEINTVEVVRRQTPRFRSPFDFFFSPRPDMDEREFRRPGLGSGVIVRQNGDEVYVLTNNHVVGDATEISVRLYDEREFEAELVGRDARTDLALVKFATREDVPVARFGDSDELYVGDWVLAIGNPLGFESTVTAGIISAVGRRPQPGSPIAGFTDYIQTDASINPGNSGGALVNLRGEVVGINTWIASRGGGSVGLGFAIPANNARRAVEDFIEEGRIVYGWLGVSIEDPTPNRLPGVAQSLGIEDTPGALVLNVHQNSPAARGGIRPGDYIVSVDGRDVSDTMELTRIVGNLAPGRRTRFRVIRAGEERVFTVRLEQRGTEEEISGAEDLWPGMATIALTDEIREQREVPLGVDGVVVAAVVADSPAADAGLRRGDVVTMVNGVDVTEVAGFYDALNRDEREVSLRVFREGTLIGLRMPGL